MFSLDGAGKVPVTVDVSNSDSCTTMARTVVDALIASGRGRIILTSSITGAITGFPGWNTVNAVLRGRCASPKLR